MAYLSNIRKQYWITFFHALIPAYVIERLFWQQRGMTVQMVVYAEIIYALTVTLGEIPSGMLSDRFGRKKLLIAYAFMGTVEFMLLLLAQNFWHFAIAILLTGIGKALGSGSANALLYDSLLQAGKQTDFEKHIGRLSAIDMTGSVIAALSGSVLAHCFNLEFNYMVSVASMCLALIFTLTLKEPPLLTKPENEMTSLSQYAKQAIGVFKAQPLTIIYCLTGAVLGACMIYLDEFWQIIFENIGIPVLLFGVFITIAAILRIPGNLLAYKLKEKFSYRRLLTVVMAVSILGYGAIFFTKNLFCLVPMMLLYWVAGIVDPLVTGYLHHHTESHIRATVESFASLGLRVVSMGIGLLFGFICVQYSIFAGFLLLGIICAMYLVIFRVVGKKFFPHTQ